MNTTLRNSLSAHRMYRLRRMAFGIAGGVVGSGVMAAVALLFAHASRTDWLAPTAANLAAMQRCEQAPGTAARQTCAAMAVAAAKLRHTAPQLAKIDGAGHETPTTH